MQCLQTSNAKNMLVSVICSYPSLTNVLRTYKLICPPDDGSFSHVQPQLLMKNPLQRIDVLYVPFNTLNNTS